MEIQLVVQPRWYDEGSTQSHSALNEPNSETGRRQTERRGRSLLPLLVRDDGWCRGSDHAETEAQPGEPTKSIVIK